MKRKPLSQMTTEEFKAELSIAGNPDKMIELKQKILVLLGDNVDATNAAELINADLVLQKLSGEVKVWAKHLRQRTRQK